VKQNGLSCSK